MRRIDEDDHDGLESSIRSTMKTNKRSRLDSQTRSSTGASKRKRTYVPTGRPRGRPRKNPEVGSHTAGPTIEKKSPTFLATDTNTVVANVETPSRTSSSGRSITVPVTSHDLPRENSSPPAAAVGGRNMALVPMSQTKEFSSATLESEKGFIVFSEEKKKRGRRGKKEQEQGQEQEQEQEQEEEELLEYEGWKAFELISLYAVHKEVDLGVADFWVRVAAGMKAKGHEKSADECKQCWEVAVEKTKERVRAKERKLANSVGVEDKAKQSVSPKRSTRETAPTRSSPRLQAA